MGIINVFLPICKCEETVSNILYVGGSGEGNYSSIQDAINISENGTIIYVYNGIYYENLLINKSIILTGENKNNTVIDGNELGTVITIISDNVTITGFTIQNSCLYCTACSTSGIKFYSNNNSISNNIITNNQIGISVSGMACYPYYLINLTYQSSNKNEIYDNLITKNSFMGIGIYRSSNSTFFRNNITSNDIGIANLISNNNYFYLNNLQNNTENVNDSGTNFWFSKGFGNYYDDYIGFDKNNDGIGDTPYDIPGGYNVDEYPLMMPYSGEIIIEEDPIDTETVFTMLVIGIIISIIFVLPIAYYWRKKYFL